MNQDEDEKGRPAKEPPLFAPDVTSIQCPRHAKQLPGQANCAGAGYKGTIVAVHVIPPPDPVQPF